MGPVTAAAALLAALASELRLQPDRARTASALAARVVEAIPDAQHVGLLHLRGSRWEALAATSALAEDADRAQLSLAEGPGLTLPADDGWLRSGDVRSERRWPRWAPAAADLGIRSTLSVPMVSRGERVGSLTMYSAEPDGFAEDDYRDLAATYAVHAAYALASEQHIADLEAATRSRHTIGIALGIVMERYELDPDRAFDFLRRVSNDQNRKLRAIAEEIVATGVLPA